MAEPGLKPYAMTQPSFQLLLYKVPALHTSISQPGLGGKGTNRKGQGRLCGEQGLGFCSLRSHLEVGSSCQGNGTHRGGRRMGRPHVTAVLTTDGPALLYFDLSLGCPVLRCDCWSKGEEPDLAVGNVL